ncbi:MAG: ABC transporter substrate-binding protein [Actinomycetaceae bacterium]|nr:ABC transporter substrate-binding protein [Arcanobacterium sp.]MDD7686579.1 ABC transporter substrate-binding protein [Actinomycetaceae bacterium]MDY5272859.1 ABC transporter substrate-binding protein [Arcanobacterium sp.]
MKKFRALAVVLALPLALTACSHGGGANGGGSGSSAVIVANDTEPQNPLIPANTNEVGGGTILDLIYAGLYYYDKDGKPQLHMAESVDTKDSVNFTIKLKKDQKFSDGSPVTAASFVNAWNQAVKQQQLNASWFSIIKGYSEDKPTDLEGLKVVDDTTFTVELNTPTSDFPVRLGYSAFYPLPEAGIGDVEAVAAFGENPISNGPYIVKKDSWAHNEKIELVPNPEYKGPIAAKNGGITFKFYSSQDAAYNDLLSGQLDVLDAVPDSAFGTYEQELGDRAVNQPGAIFQSFTFPKSDTRFQGEAGQLRKQAISMAINREEITKTIFQGTRQPATDFVAPVIPGHSDSLAGADVLTYNPEKAKELWKQADAIEPWTGDVEIAYNSDGGHQAWVDATMNSIKNTLGIEAKGAPYADFKSLRKEITDRAITKAFRTGWQGDYPGISNFLEPIYMTGASANDGDYSNADFDALLKKAASQPSVEEANKLYIQAEESLLKDLPCIPLWYSNLTGGSAEGVKDVVFGWNTKPLLYNVTK